MKVNLGKNDLIFASGVEGGKDAMVSNSTGIASDYEVNAGGRCVGRQVSGFVKDLFHISKGNKLSKLLASEVLVQFTAPKDRGSGI